MTDLEGALMDIARQVWSDGEPDQGIVERATARFVAAAGAVEGALGDDDYLVGQRVLGRRHRRRLGARLRPHRRAHGASGGLVAYVDRLEARPARQRAVAVALPA